MKAHEIFCEQLLKDFCNQITGNGVNMLINKHPEDCFIVGMLVPRMEVEEETSTSSSSVLVSQLGIDFFLTESDIANAIVKVKPQGDLFYRSLTSLEEQRKACFMELGMGEKSLEQFTDATKDLEELNNGNGMKEAAVYKRISLSEIIPESYPIRLSDFYNPITHSGRMPEDYPANVAFHQVISKKTAELSKAKDAYSHSAEPIVYLKDLQSEEAWDAFQRRAHDKDSNPIQQNWLFDITCDMQKTKEDTIRVSIKINNNSKYQKNTKTGKKQRRETERVTDLFNAGVSIDLDGCSPVGIEMDAFKDDYKYNRIQYAIGSGCTVNVSDDHCHLETALLPVFVQRRLKTRPNTEVRFDDLIQNYSSKLREINAGMNKELTKWQQQLNAKRKAKELTEKGFEQFEKEIDGFKLEIDRFACGIEVLEDNLAVRKAFIMMNQAFKNSAKKYTGWRLFQIVFIVSLIPDIVACDPGDHFLTASQRKKTHLDQMDLLYFPTGGGKTEAFLGIMVFNLFFDRIRGKDHGVTAILKYPLRLLSVQQVQRVADILASSEIIRRNDDDTKEGDVFRVGYYVGDNNTPNKIDDEVCEKLDAMTPEQMDEEYRVIDICPFCRQKSVHIGFEREERLLKHYCNNQECEGHKELPLYISDTDVYRRLPSVIISTIDKMAAIGNNRRFKNILGSVSQYCPKHGYHELGPCEEKDCIEAQEEVSLYDAAPSLFIQDELHLVRESLGTYDSHYESMIHYMISELSDSHRPAKIIGATATIASYENQVQNLYMKSAIRFPCASPYVGKVSYTPENFYAYEDETDLHRLVLGYAPFGRAIINSVVYSMKAMHVCINQYLEHPEKILAIPNIGIETIEEARKVAEDYWFMLEYNNVKVDGNNVLNALDDPINTELVSEGLIPFSAKKMTGDDTFQDVRKTLAEVESVESPFKADFNLIVATSMISHGVDADRFNNMFFFGIPGNMAEYIQAYSRVGRKWPGIVIDIIRPTREREVSWQKNFIKVHEYKDILVDPVPINRWASKAIEQTLPGLFCALILNHYTYQLRDEREKIYMGKGLQKAIEKGWITREEITEHLYRVYGCSSGEYEYARGNQYKKKIKQMVDQIFDALTESSYSSKDYITGILPWKVMNSLRDTDEGVIVELR